MVNNPNEFCIITHHQEIDSLYKYSKPPSTIQYYHCHTHDKIGLDINSLIEIKCKIPDFWKTNRSAKT